MISNEKFSLKLLDKKGELDVLPGYKINIILCRYIPQRVYRNSIRLAAG